jgi:hypothetical protein
MSPGKERALLLVGLMASTIPALQAEATDTAAQMFKNFEMSVPFATQMLINYHHFLYALPLLVVVVWFYPRWRNRRGIASAIAGVTISVLGFFIIGGLLYLPIFLLPPAQ